MGQARWTDGGPRTVAQMSTRDHHHLTQRPGSATNAPGATRSAGAPTRAPGETTCAALHHLPVLLWTCLGAADGGQQRPTGAQPKTARATAASFRGGGGTSHCPPDSFHCADCRAPGRDCSGLPGPCQRWFASVHPFLALVPIKKPSPSAQSPSNFPGKSPIPILTGRSPFSETAKENLLVLRHLLHPTIQFLLLNICLFSPPTSTCLQFPLLDGSRRFSFCFLFPFLFVLLFPRPDPFLRHD